MRSLPVFFIYTALPCEAKPLLNHFRLKKKIECQPFTLYSNDKICLTVTGLGKNAMAAGVAYSQALYVGVDNPVLINIGVAGHRDETIGTPFIAHKIIDADTGRKFYPVPTYSWPCASDAVVTTSKPQLHYDHEYLCDMEAAAFYETASRFSTGELIHSLKVVSDNRATPADRLDAKQVSGLIADNMVVLDVLMSQLGQQAKKLVTTPTDEFDFLIRQYHFTVSEQIQLKNQLLRWRVLTGYQALSFDTTALGSGRDVLRWLEHKINVVDVIL